MPCSSRAACLRRAAKPSLKVFTDSLSGPHVLAMTFDADSQIAPPSDHRADA